MCELSKSKGADMLIYCIYLYNIYKYIGDNMASTTLLHSPTLESVIMVEKIIQKHSQECGKYQLWKKLPKKMMYQTFQTILSYLEKSGKIMVDKDGVVIWLYDPEGIKKILASGVIVR